LGSRSLFLFFLPLPSSIPHSICDANPKSLLYFYGKCGSTQTDIEMDRAGERERKTETKREGEAVWRSMRAREGEMKS